MLGRASARFRSFFIETENVRLMLGLIGLLVIISYALPRVPGFSRLEDGINCTQLSHPPGGNQRSLLSLRNDTQQLELEVLIQNEGEDTVGDPLVASGESLIIRVVFTNEDIGPAYLYYRENEETIQPFDKANPGPVAGVIFTIENLDAPLGNAFLNDNNTGRQPFAPKSQFDLQDIFVLQARHRCSLDFEITREQMLRMQPAMQPGKYQIRAYYHNPNPGIPQHASNATATPMFDTQGIWTGVAESRAVRFSVAPTAPQ